jgi:hypothetical protein
MLESFKFSFSSVFLPIKGRLIGRMIGNFFEELLKSIPKKKIEVQMTGIGELFAALMPLMM